MYIEFSQRFADKFVENDTEEMWTSLDRAMYAAVDGVHVVSCETRSCAEQMAEKARAQSKGKLCSFLLAIKENIIDLHAVRSLMSFYIIISSDSTTNLQQSILTADCIAVGIDFSCLGTFWQKTRLLAEDSYDCVFYHWICTHEQRKQRELANVMIQLESTNGGGAGLYDEYNRLTQEKRAILCFADSDKKCPSDPMGSTAKKFSVNDIMMLSEYHVLNACELENLFFSSVLSSNLNIGKNTSSIDNIISSKEEIFPEIRMFFDVKNGFSRKFLLKHSFLKGIFNPSNICAKKGTKCYRRCKKCKDPVIEGYCRTYFDFLYKKYVRNNLFDDQKFENDVQNLPSVIADEWSVVGKKMLNWGCGYKIRTHGI